MKMNKVMLLIPILIGIMFVLPLINAVTTVTMNSPKTDYNYSSTMTLNCTVALGGAGGHPINYTIKYNASGGSTLEADTLFTSGNTSAEWLSFQNASYDISSLADAATYNFSCIVSNATNTYYSAQANGISIDDTVPSGTIWTDSNDIGVRDSILVSWSDTDATSGITTVLINITTPDSGRCPTIKESYGVADQSGFKSYADDYTACAGTYTLQMWMIDESGNSAAATNATFKASASGLTKSGSNTLGGTSKSKLSQGSEINSNRLPLGETGTDIAIILLIGVGVYYFFLRKK